MDNNKAAFQQLTQSMEELSRAVPLKHRPNYRKLYNADEADTLYTAGPYAVQICKIYDQSISEELFGYGLYNTVTGLREAETRRLSSAQRLADRMWEEDVEVEQAKQQLELFQKQSRSKLT